MDDQAGYPEIELPYAGVAALPRMSLIHLMAITATTALALAPMQFQQEFARRIGSMGPVVVSEPTLPAQITSVTWGIASGGSLFAVIALVVWRRQGYETQLEPGHWLAVELAAQWAAIATFWVQFQLARDFNPFLYAAFAGPQFAIGLGFVIWFLYLATRRTEPLIWRCAFAVLALAPIAGTMLGMILLFATAARVAQIENQMTVMLLPQLASSVGQAAILIAAMASDVRHQRPRHWTHWVAVSLKLLLIASLALNVVAMWIDPPQFRR